MTIDAVRAEYQHIRLTWAHEENVRKLTSFVKYLDVLAGEAQAHRDEDLATNIEALALKIKHRANVRLNAAN